MVKDSVGEIPIKKRRKNSISTTVQTSTKVFEGDIYKGVINYEENEAMSRNPDKDKDLFNTTCDEIRNILEEISVLKTKEDSKALITEKRIQACMKFVILKKLNRLEKFRTKNSRDTLNKVKQQVDSYHLQLQNLLYEILHLQKEVNKCLQFKSKDEEIDLVSVEEFFKEAPENVSRPKITQNDPHQLKLARLEWELDQRKQLAELCKHLQTAKETVSNGITKKRERLNNLTPRLRTILDATKPLQDYLGLPLDRIRKQHQTAQLLPKPLFVLYVQSDAYREACDSNLTVTVIGDQEEALIQSMPEKTPSNNDSDSDQELEETEKRHHRKLSKVDRLEAKRNQLLVKHPLSVELIFKQEDENQLTLKFYYFVNLHVVAVEPHVQLTQPIHGTFAGDLLTKENILKCLFPHDSGQESPNMANHYQLQHVGLEFFDISQLGLPYIWAQRIAGLDFMSTTTISEEKASTSTSSASFPEISHSVSQASVERVMRAIRNRFKARIALYKQILQLEQANVRVPEQLNNARFPPKIYSILESWQPLTWKEYSQTKQTNILLQEGLISEEDIFYRAVITRGSAKMIAFVAVKCNYPLTPALFTLRLFWHGEHHATNNDSIRDIERELNVYWQELVTSKGWAYSLMAAQLMRLEMCLDVYLETSDSGSPPEFPRDKVFFQGFRGRERSRPYKFLNRANGIFTQR